MVSCLNGFGVELQERCLLLLVIGAASVLVPGSIRHVRLSGHRGTPCQPQQITQPVYACHINPPAVLVSPHRVTTSAPVADFPVVPAPPHKEEADEEGVAGGAGELMTSEDAEAAAMDLLGGDLETSSPSTDPGTVLNLRQGSLMLWHRLPAGYCNTRCVALQHPVCDCRSYHACEWQAYVGIWAAWLQMTMRPQELACFQLGACNDNFW